MKTWTDKLTYNYPLMFVDRWALPTVLEGWHPIVERVCAFIAKHDLNNEVKVVQVKEKLAGLRFYYYIKDTSSELYTNIEEVVRAAEIEASKTCEYCGAPGKMVGKGWVKTMCEPCALKAFKKR